MSLRPVTLFKRGFGIFNRARLGFPGNCYIGTGGIGDDLMCTTVFRELRKRGARGCVFATQTPGLFKNNRDLDTVIDTLQPRWGRWLREGLPFVELGYARYDPVTDHDEPLTEHVLAKICRIAGLTGALELRPYVYLSPAELAGGRLGENQIAIQSSGLAAAHSMQNKEWFPDRFQAVCDHFRAGHTLVQIGSARDPVLEGVIDMRGKTDIRQSAAILANSLLFVGLEGFIMHLARSVDCRSVIIYGGRLRPWQIGYVTNINLIGDTPCSPCWFRNRCDFDHECMRIITPAEVIQAAQDQMGMRGSPLLAETAVL